MGWRAQLLTDGVIDHDAWEAARTGFVTVAFCPVCGGAMRAERPELVRRVRWYTAVCSGCGHEITAPNGRVRVPRQTSAEVHGGGGLLADHVDTRRPGERDAS
jgi:hypothetical protein